LASLEKRRGEGREYEKKGKSDRRRRTCGDMGATGGRAVPNYAPLFILSWKRKKKGEKRRAATLKGDVEEVSEPF